MTEDKACKSKLQFELSSHIIDLHQWKGSFILLTAFLSAAFSQSRAQHMSFEQLNSKNILPSLHVPGLRSCPPPLESRFLANYIHIAIALSLTNPFSFFHIYHEQTLLVSDANTFLVLLSIIRINLRSWEESRGSLWGTAIPTSYGGCAQWASAECRVHVGACLTRDSDPRRWWWCLLLLFKQKFTARELLDRQGCRAGTINHMYHIRVHTYNTISVHTFLFDFYFLKEQSYKSE